MNPSRTLFDRYARHYRAMEFRPRLPDDLERLKRDRLPPWIDEIPKDASILDVGCAEGHWLEALRRVGFTNLTGIEVSPQLLAIARKRLPDTVTLIEADLRDWLQHAPIEAYDVIFFHDVLEHLPREPTIQVLQSFYRILKPGGWLSVRVPNMASLVGSFNMAIDFIHVTHFTEYSLLQVLESAGFASERIVLTSQAPRLFWSWKRPHRPLLRLLNRLRWHINNTLHAGCYLLSDFIRPKILDPYLLMVARK